MATIHAPAFYQNPPPPSSYDKPVKPGRERSLREFCEQRVDGHTMSSLAIASGVSYSTIYRHVEQKLAISPKNAKKLQDWSKGRINASKTMWG